MKGAISVALAVTSKPLLVLTNSWSEKISRRQAIVRVMAEFVIFSSSATLLALRDLYRARKTLTCRYVSDSRFMIFSLNYILQSA